jgi:hypothetical protein
MKIIYKLICLTFILFPFSVMGQNVYQIIEGKALLLTCQDNGAKIQWQSSSDNVVWQDMANETNDSVLTQPGYNMFYRAKLGEEDCSYYSNTTEIKVTKRPEDVRSLSWTHEVTKKLFSCTWNTFVKTNLLVCKVSYYYTLSWQMSKVSGVIISIDPQFLPKDGVSYDTGNKDLVFKGNADKWYTYDLFRGIQEKNIYLFTFTSDLIYSTGYKYTLFSLTDYYDVGYSDYCNCGN